MNGSTKKDTRPDVGASERAGLDAEAWQATASNPKFTTPAPTGARVHIADFLSKGEAHAIPLLHLPARTVRLMIRAERLAGTPILESSRADGGYYLPDRPDERARCVKRLRHRAMEIERVARAIEGVAGLD